ncbi:hypothetical protein GGI25_005206 [Coemansia spiralis]|uniref:Uncharacterized protein n=2 Tax=Coemansia TaxID=4863 RepID=A0A9W8G542_9FUNG|nr:hypothetical protein BX070DRAFT_218252 [Coemansia spiralis]KAJ1990354.1 hypothetical protein EDC05_004118 [Coemansia umbellata]KAJ2620747.1 hypothetical protein GGI26_004735 [Coemansia sp. RSA 1358]KAJ2672174.1 hypothetical protein GGI25_005206 [Coemansia spiralis]
MDSEAVAEKTNRAPAMVAGGRRKSKPTNIPHLAKNSEDRAPSGKDARDEEGGDESRELLRQEEKDKEFLMEQTKKQQKHDIKFNQKHTNAELNRAPNIIANKNIRQPQRFGSGIPLESRKILKENGMGN